MKPSPPLSLATAALTLCFAGASLGQQLPPDDPSVADDLAVWFRDAASTFDPDTGIWSDSGGNGIDATPVGEVDVGGPVTYAAPTAGTVAGGAFDGGADLASVHFTGSENDLSQALDINGGENLDALTIFVAMNVATVDSNGLTRPVGIGSVAAIQFNNGDNVNLGCDPSIRKDNGQLGRDGYSLPFPTGTTFVRTFRMSPTAIDEWFNIDGTAQKVISIAGSSYTTSTDDFFLGDLRAGPTAIPGVFGGGTSVADFDIVQTMVYTAALSDEQVLGINEWMAGNITGAGGGGPAPLAITAVEFNADHSEFTLTWNSRPGRIYAVDHSADLTAPDWPELDDSVPSGGAETSYTNSNPRPGAPAVFFRVREFEG